MKLSQTVSKLWTGHECSTISILKISKGNNSAKNVGGVTVVNLCTSSDHGLYCTKFRGIISNGIKVMDRTRMFNR